MINKTRIAFLLGVLLGACPLVHADTTLSNLASWNGRSEIDPFGGPGGAASTYGETFIAPTDSVLQSFTFEVKQTGNTSIYAQVYAWTGNLVANNPTQGATGPALFSTPLTLVGTGDFVAETINTGGVALTAGDPYIILFYDPDQTGAHADFGDTLQPGTSSGGFNYNFVDEFDPNNTINGGDWRFETTDFGDLAYSATFTAPPVVSSTPEPSSLALLGTGLVGAMGIVRRRLRA